MLKKNLVRGDEMKNRKVATLWTAGISAFFSFLINTQYTFAATMSGFDGKGKLPNLIDSYSSYLESNHTAADWVGKAAQNITNILNAIANLFFSIAKFIYMAFDTMISGLMKVDILGDYADAIQSVTKALYESMFSNLGVLIVFIAMLIIFGTFVFKSPEQGVKQFLKVIGVVVLAMVWFNKSGYYIKAANNIAGTAQDYMSVSVTANKGKVVVNKTSKTGNAEADKEQMKADKGTFLSNLRESYFKTAVERPYYLINYATLNTDTIKKRSGKDNSVTALLDNSNNPVQAQEKVQKKVDKLNTYKTGGGSDNDTIVNYAVQNGYVQNKIGVAAVAVVPALTWGIIYSILALLIVLLQLLVIFVDLFMPILAIISLLPKYSNLFVGGLKNIVMMIFAQLFFGFIMICLQFISTLSDLVIKVTDVGSYLGNSFLFLMIIYLLWRFRETIKGVMMKPLNAVSTAKGEGQTVKREATTIANKIANVGNPDKNKGKGNSFIDDKSANADGAVNRKQSNGNASAGNLTDTNESVVPNKKGFTQRFRDAMNGHIEEPMTKDGRSVAEEPENETVDQVSGQQENPDASAVVANTDEVAATEDLGETDQNNMPDLTQSADSDLTDPVVTDGEPEIKDVENVNSVAAPDLQDPEVTATEDGATTYNTDLEDVTTKEPAAQDLTATEVQDVPMKPEFKGDTDLKQPNQIHQSSGPENIKSVQPEQVKSSEVGTQPKTPSSKTVPSQVGLTQVNQSDPVVRQVKVDSVHQAPPALHQKEQVNYQQSEMPKPEQLYHYEKYENGDDSGRKAYPANNLVDKLRGKKK